MALIKKILRASRNCHIDPVTVTRKPCTWLVWDGFTWRCDRAIILILELLKHHIPFQVNDELIYIDVLHNTSAPSDATPIRTEEATVYAALDLQQMSSFRIGDGNSDQGKPSSSHEDDDISKTDDQTVYENFTVETEADSTQ